jgi:hypothetical protein
MAMIEASKLYNDIHFKLINEVHKKIINSIFSKIKDANSNNLNEINYELPYYFEDLYAIIEKNQLTINDLRILIWGEILEILKQKGFDVYIDIQKNEERCYLIIKWVTVLDKYKDRIMKYRDLINHSFLNQ